MFNFSMAELGIILVIALMVFGPGKLPDVGKALGRNIREVRQAANEINSPNTEKEESLAVGTKARKEMKHSG
ncbi:Sec-independent protein translocase subunit TatA/TatB [Sporomusa acidovorans]|uniref:Sec-independent protein translocase protein TatA n=1 Tax=Sporomusa acidovorans (strain ATCC 49682 / DSM 3132 / Mol) TaxID=1123286 RepID=A0ABZ3J0F9_SPOA4|nr:twin-arginine translocase TatA/TatE family subunit [Sporomusa acidovorans]OZC21383.1 Sec-independent protein translocase protein TatAd [Sporomusa acidovorans DSM 3132]SDE55721.1 Sec-independent protein translocase TatA [Sporomusa acidovorans]